MADFRNRKNGYFWLPLVLAAGVVGGIFIGKYIASTHRSAGEEKLRVLMDLIGNRYVDEVNVDSLLEVAFPQLLSALDPHSSYIPAEELRAVDEELDAKFSGVGVSFQIINDSVVVVEVVAGGPAEKVGLLAGDRIVECNGVKLTGKEITNQDVFKNLRGEAETKAKLKVKRPSVAKLIDFEVIRGDVPVTSVDCVYMINDNTGYVKVTKFARDTYSEFMQALASLKDQGAQKFVIDLRGNTGGFMEQAIYMSNEFLPKGQKIVFTKGRTPDNESMAVSDGNGSFTEEEIVVLTNEMSASASEIFAGAIQDNDRGLVIGRRTFGKGLVQEQMLLPDSSAIRLTVARYFTPSGRSIQKEYERGKSEQYGMDIANRYSHGEFYNADSVKLDKSKKYKTLTGRTVFGGGGIMPDIFVPEDTSGYTSYYIAVANRGLLQDFAFSVADKYRSLLKGAKTPEQLLRVLPRDETLLENFVNYAVGKGVPARWYYINQSRDLLLRQIKAFIARDVLGYNAFFRLLNENDPVVDKAVEVLKVGKSPAVLIPNQGKSKK